MESVGGVGVSKWKRVIKLLDRKQHRARRGRGIKEGLGGEVNKQERL